MRAGGGNGEAQVLCADCPLPVAGTLVTGCVHEHVTRIAACWLSVTAMRAAMNALESPVPCRGCEPDHLCYPRITVEWSGGSTEVLQEAGGGS